MASETSKTLTAGQKKTPPDFSSGASWLLLGFLLDDRLVHGSPKCFDDLFPAFEDGLHGPVRHDVDQECRYVSHVCLREGRGFRPSVVYQVPVFCSCGMNKHSFVYQVLSGR